MSRSRIKHRQHHVNGSSNTNINRHGSNNYDTIGNIRSRDATAHDMWDSEVDSALLNFDLVQRIH